MLYAPQCSQWQQVEMDGCPPMLHSGLRPFGSSTPMLNLGYASDVAALPQNSVAKLFVDNIDIFCNKR